MKQRLTHIRAFLLQSFLIGIVTVYIVSPLHNEVFSLLHHFSHYVHSNIGHTHHDDDEDHDHDLPVMAVTPTEAPAAHAHSHKLLSFIKTALGFAETPEDAEKPAVEFKFPKHILPQQDSHTQLLAYRTIQPIGWREKVHAGREQDVTTPPPQAF